MLSLNLISQEEKNQLKSLKNFALFKHIYYLFVSFFVFVLTLFIFSYLILNNFNSTLQESLDKEVSSRQSGQNTSINDIIIKLNKQLSQIVQLQNKFINWSKVINDVSNGMPAGVTINKIELDQLTKTFKISGTTASRESFQNLQTYLNSNSYFIEVNYPSINLAQKTDMPFDISGKLTDRIYEN